MNFHTPTLLCIGECMVEMAPLGDSTYRMGFAGDTFNTAWYARKLFPEDWSVDYFTAVGDDSSTGEMLEFMEASNIGTDNITRLKGETVGLYMIQLKDGERSFSYWRNNSAARQLAANVERLTAITASAGIIYFSGITLAILSSEHRANLFLALKTARAAGAKIAFDPNLRPRLWTNNATMCATITEAAALSDIVLPSFEDEAIYFGDSTPTVTAARYAAPTVIVKNGENEVLIVEGGITQTYTPVSVENVIDSTAAGDSFNAGFFSALVAGGSAMDGVVKGARTSAKVITQRGALVTL